MAGIPLPFYFFFFHKEIPNYVRAVDDGDAFSLLRNVKMSDAELFPSFLNPAPGTLPYSFRSSADDLGARFIPPGFF